MIHRRSFLIGLISALAAPAIVRAESIMPVRALIITPPDPFVRGIRWQSWPYGSLRPDEFAEGSIGPESERGVLKPLSRFVEYVERHRQFYPNLCWKPMLSVNPELGQKRIVEN